MIAFKNLPPGEYLMVITASRMKSVYNEAFLKLVFEVMEGEFKGRKVWCRVKLPWASFSKDPLEFKLARAEISAICRAVGVMNPNELSELHNIPLVVTIRQTISFRSYAKREATK